MTEQEAIKEVKRWTSILMSAGSKCVSDTAEAQDMAIKALEKQMAKKVIETEKFNVQYFQCSECGFELYIGQIFCDECGQKLDWSDEE